MNDPMYRCGRGWLLEPQEDGTILPFFIKTRYNDVIYYPEMIYADNLLEELTSYRKTIHGSSELSVRINGWDVVIYEDHSYTAKIVLPLVTDDVTEDNGERFVKNDVVTSGLFGYVTLPFTSLNGLTDLHIQTSSAGACRALLNSDIIAVPGTKEDNGGTFSPIEGVLDQDITEIFLQVSSRETIPAEFMEDAALKKGIIYMTVDGNIDLTAETLIPEIALAAAYSGVLSFS